MLPEDGDLSRLHSVMLSLTDEDTASPSTLAEDEHPSTTNSAVQPDGSNVDEAPSPKTNPHICYSEVVNFDQDLADLIATCQRHIRCLLSAHPHWPTEVQIWVAETALVTKDEDPVLLTARNVGLINSFICMACQCGHAVLCARSSSTALNMPPRANLDHSRDLCHHCQESEGRQFLSEGRPEAPHIQCW